jgi:DNA-binding NtrC family response regulator
MLMNRTANQPDISSTEPTQWHPPHTAARILVVDDDADIRQLNASVLKASGYEVDMAVDGDAAWAILDKQCYDLLITDHSMPKLTGIELLNELHVSGKSLPSILVSGDLPTHELRRHPWLRISATLLKPYTAPELLSTVRQVLQVTAESRELEAPPHAQEQEAESISAPWRL